MKKRVVVTGIGATSPLGGTADDSWQALLRGESGARTIEEPWVAQYGLPVDFAARLRVPTAEVLTRIEIRRMDPTTQVAVVAAREAWADASAPEVDPQRLTVEFAQAMGGMWTMLNTWDLIREKGVRSVLPMTAPMIMPNAAAAVISLDFHARGGARTTLSACASSTESLINAYERLSQGLADVTIAGGAESVIHPFPLAALSTMQAISTRNDEPAAASRPYEVTRDGFVMGEGAGALVLETEEHALARGARIYAELVGGAVSADGYHMTAPQPEGLGAARALEAALVSAGAVASDVSHINAHATSTPVGDLAEYRAMARVFGEALPGIPVSATKASTGHLLGGSGAIEAIFTVLALHQRMAPPTINLREQDPQIPLDVVTSPRPLGDGPLLALSNSFGFGGHNAVVAFRDYPQ